MSYMWHGRWHHLVDTVHSEVSVPSLTLITAASSSGCWSGGWRPRHVQLAVGIPEQLVPTRSPVGRSRPPKSRPLRHHDVEAISGTRARLNALRLCSTAPELLVTGADPGEPSIRLEAKGMFGGQIEQPQPSFCCGIVRLGIVDVFSSRS